MLPGTIAARIDELDKRASRPDSGLRLSSERAFRSRACIFLLTFVANNLIYESHCDFFSIAKFDVRENHSMKSATKKPAKKKAAPKKKK